ncbi:MAG TPA: hypothetical protein VKV74_14015 [Bryobacteraceae bacterium]|nr:hypothetical protein [Bryobacteraceae bacterium]
MPVQYDDGGYTGANMARPALRRLLADKVTEPSAITMPAATVEKLLPSASLALTINGVN